MPEKNGQNNVPEMQNVFFNHLLRFPAKGKTSRLSSTKNVRSKLV